MTQRKRKRQPEGSPIGGQYAPENRGRGEDLEVPRPKEFTERYSSQTERYAAYRQAVLRGVKETTIDPEAYMRYLNFASQFHKYSANNQLMVYAQYPHASQIGSYKKWSEAGYQVRKGEKALYVWAPVIGKKEDSSGSTEVDPGTGKPKTELKGFKAVPVFDISQTDAPPDLHEHLPRLTGPAPEGMVKELEGLIAKEGYEVRTDHTGQAWGWASSTRKEVVISDKAEPAQRAKTLAHELAHIRLKHEGYCSHDDRQDKEIEAESVAYMVAQGYGFDTSSYSFGYVNNWCEGDMDKVQKRMGAVVKVAQAIEEDILKSRDPHMDGAP